MLWQYRTGLGLIYINTEPLNKTLVGLYYQRNPVAYEFKKKNCMIVCVYIVLLCENNPTHDIFWKIDSIE